LESLKPLRHNDFLLKILKILKISKKYIYICKLHTQTLDRLTHNYVCVELTVLLKKTGDFEYFEYFASETVAAQRFFLFDFGDFAKTLWRF